MPTAIPAIALVLDSDELALTSESPGGTSPGRTAPLTIRVARDSSKMPNASGNSINDSRRVARIQARVARPPEATTMAQRKLPR